MPEAKSITLDSNIGLDVSENYVNVLSLSKAENNTRPFYDAFKRVFDFCSSLLALVVLMPVLLIIALIIYADDKGNPIFSQYRCGKNGELFKMYKFRTMCVDAEKKLEELQQHNEMDGPVFKIKHDPRITRVGGFLRASGLDELPQLVNILCGQMSVVGPRPALPKEVAHYGDKEMIRLSVKPGLTCYWQIAPERNSIPFSEWMELDKQYILDRNIAVDFLVILKTVVAVIKRQGC